MKKAALFIAALLLLADSGAALAETAMVEQFTLLNDEVPVPCDVERIISAALAEKGCETHRKTSHLPPDLIISGSYGVERGSTYAVVNAFDTVSGQLLLDRTIALPKDEHSCVEAVGMLANEVADPSFYPRRQNYFDATTGIEFVYVPGGSFQLGFGDSKGKQVQLAGFFIGRHEVTQAQWKSVMAENPSFFTGDLSLPVENVSWLDAMDFIRRLNEKTGMVYRLPTEIEWEYAARARGRNYKWSGTNQSGALSNFAWLANNSEQKTNPVGKKRANALGIHDMSGNVWEWCQDRVACDSPETPFKAVIRGGSWMMDENYAYTFARELSSPGSRYQDNGFRLVLEVSPHKEVASVPSMGPAPKRD